MLVQTQQELETRIAQTQSSRFIAVDVETTGLDLLDAEVIGIGFATLKDAWYVDFPSFQGEARQIWEALLPLFDLERYILISHNTPFDLYYINRELKTYTSSPPDFFKTCLNWWDTLSMAALADENLIGVKVELEERKIGALSLKALSRIFLGRAPRLWEETFVEWTPEEKAEYGCADVRNTYDLANFFARFLQENQLLDYYQKYVAPMAFVTCTMETFGLKVDVPKLLETQEEVRANIATRLQQVVDLMPPQETVVIDLSLFEGDVQPPLAAIVATLKDSEGFLTKKGKVSTSKATLSQLYGATPNNPFWKKVLTYDYTPSNPNSYTQLANYLLGRGYRLPMTPAGNYSVSADILAVVASTAPDDPLWTPLFSMRKLEKLHGTYIRALLELAWEDGTVHPEWNQAGTVTGRYSTSVSGENKQLRHKRGPALQTIPRPDTIKEAGWEYNPREWFLARPGYALCIADLSQAEVRMLAVQSQDPVLVEAIRTGEDIHVSVAERIYGRTWQRASDDERKVLRGHAKMVTFGTIYGIGPNALAERLGLTYEEAQELLNDFYSSFEGVTKWKQNETRQLVRYGYVLSYLGRRRTPVLLQDPPRVTSAEGAEQHNSQKLREALWMAEYDHACAKSGFDPEMVEEQEIVSRAVRQAINFEVQGSVAELINYGLWQLVRAGFRVLGQIHDEVLVEVPDIEKDKVELEGLLREVYEVTLNGVPFKLDVAFGSSWAAK